MDLITITLEDGTEKQVHGIFYLYNSKYYFIYTENEIDEKGYVVLHLTQVGKEIVNTPDGKRIDTGKMIGMELTDANEWKSVQASITKIVEDKKNNTQSPEIKYFDINMINGIKILSKKTFRFLRTLIEGCFNLNIEDNQNLNQDSNQNIQDQTQIIDYRTSFFQEQTKNQELQMVIDQLNNKIEQIKQIIG